MLGVPASPRVELHTEELKVTVVEAWAKWQFPEGNIHLVDFASPLSNFLLVLRRMRLVE